MLDIPLIGFGTWELYGKACEQAVKIALEIGYRHIDTAHMYENHHEIRKAIHGHTRSDLFLTSKFMPSQILAESVEETCNRALKELGTDYLDLYLIHYPEPGSSMKKMLKDLGKLKAKGKCRFTGVSNFSVSHIEDVIEVGYYPEANKVEFNLYFYQKE